MIFSKNFTIFAFSHIFLPILWRCLEEIKGNMMGLFSEIDSAASVRATIENQKKIDKLKETIDRMVKSIDNGFIIFFSLFLEEIFWNGKGKLYQLESSST